ncbi:MAG TPA: hypothetical protein VHR45_24560 [Thermoanaerobaculia bacterium]|nr:hypothetical protein [Thermoanaerobaculia bacterium]
MRKTLMFALVLSLVAAFAYAQTAAPAPAPPAGGAATTTTTAPGATTTTTTKATGGKTSGKSGKSGKGKSASGDVASVDDAAKTFTVHPKTGSDWTFGTNDNTTYWVGKKKGSWSDVKAGADVTVHYKVDGTNNVASSVKIKVAKAAAAAKAPKTGK